MSLEKDKKSLALIAIFSGLGMGLLLGIIMGLSVSPTVKTVMGSLTAILGGFLGFDGITKGKEENRSVGYSLTAGLRAGSFGFAVVIGILSGMIIRTNELFAPSTKDRVDEWRSAGYTKEEAKKIVLYQKLAIDPVTGEAKEIGDMQRQTMNSLFKSDGDKQLSEQLDPDLWNNNIETAVVEAGKIEIKELSAVFENVSKLIPADQQFVFLKILQMIVYQMEENDTNFCDLPEGMIEWEDNTLRDLGDIITTLDTSTQKEIIGNLKILFCKLETSVIK